MAIFIRTHTIPPPNPMQPHTLTLTATWLQLMLRM